MDILRVLNAHRTRFLLADAAIIAAVIASVAVGSIGQSRPPARGQGSSLPHTTQLKNINLSAYSKSTGASTAADQRIQSDESLRGPTLTIAPAPVSVNPTISQQDAVSAWLTTGMLPGTTTSTAPSSVLFGLLTDTEYGTLQPDGSDKPTYTQQPVWVIEYSNAIVPLSGGAAGTNGPTSSTGRLDAFIDANTGKYMYAFSQTKPIPTSSLPTSGS